MNGFGTYLKDYLSYESISQSQFAFQLGITQKHMNSILNGKAELSVELMMAISVLTEIDLRFIAKIENNKRVSKYISKNFETDQELKEYLKKYKFKELQKKEWITYKDITSLNQVVIDLLEFLKIKDFDVMNAMDNRVLFKKKEDKKELLALWIARCDQLAKTQEVEEYNKKNINYIIKEVNNYVYEHSNINVEYLTKLLNDNGMYFVVEEALPSTKVRGSFKIYKGKPAVYLSSYGKTVDGIVYALFHELAHCKSDYNQAKAKVIIEGSKEQEERADTFAYTNMVPKTLFNKLLTNFSEENILKESIKNKIPMCYLVSQLTYRGPLTYTGMLYKKYKKIIERKM